MQTSEVTNRLHDKRKGPRMRKSLKYLNILALLSLSAHAYADIGASINSCVTALSATGGVCDFRSMGANSTATLITLNKPVTLLLEDTQITFTGSAQIVVSAAGVRIEGTTQSTKLVEGVATVDVIAGSAAQDLEIRGISFVGVGESSCGTASGDAIRLTNSSAGSIARIRVTANDFSGFCEHGVHIQNATDVWVTDNVIWNTADGIRFSGVLRGTIAHNNLYDQMYAAISPYTFGIAIGLDSVNAQSGISYPPCNDIQIIGNTIGVSSSGMGYSNSEGILVHAGSNVTISGNNLHNVLFGIGVNPFTSGDVISNVTIVGNTYVGPTTTNATAGSANSGISVSGAAPNTIPSNIVISNNAVFQANVAFATPNSAYAGIAIGANKAVVTGNVISSVGASGIELLNPSNYLLVTDNYVYNVSGSGSSGLYANAAGLSTMSGRIRTNFVTSAANGYNFCNMTASSGLLFGANDTSSVTTAVQCGTNVTQTTF